LPIKFEQQLKSLVRRTNFNYILFLSVFSGLLFFINTSGIIPYAYTITSQFIMTFLFSWLFIGGLWLQTFFTIKLNGLNHFLPHGVPVIIIPFIIIIESVSTLSRVISLAVRLFANITAGHALLKILANFELVIVTLPFFIVGAAGSVLFGVVLIVSALELLIACLQAYVFVTLALIYIAEQE
jgi:F-type H+-transporting ATPase subunit a